MPIIGLTDNGAAFPRIGELRKGAEKPATGNRPGADLDYFRFTSTDPLVLSKFTAAYPGKANQINIFFPYATTDENFEAWQEEWGAGSLKHRCNGQHVVMIQRNGRYEQPAPGTVKCPGGCKQVGRLKVIIPELGRLAYVVALTTSIWDITEVHSNLTAYEALRGDLRGIPFILSRVPRMISTPGKDGRVRREKWLWHIEAASEWVVAQLSAMRQQALPSANRLALASGIDEATGEILEPDAEPEIDEGEYTEQSAPAANGRIADIRASLDELKTFTLGIVADRAAMTEHYDNSHHALNAMKSFKFPDGVNVAMGQKVSKKGALELFDWLIERKQPLFDDGYDYDPRAEQEIA